MTKRMLIDDTQPEETRVVIVNGNKVEDVELESSFRKQIKGNIYLAKVMRIEPSLQAAFVDYGGNKHGFLAFGEIHPDYYNISDEVLAEVEKEVDEAIEAKKQYLKERELEREKAREERARERARIEEEKKSAEASSESTVEVSEPPIPVEPQQTVEETLIEEDDKHKRKKRILKKRIKKQQEQQAELLEPQVKETVKTLAAEISEEETVKEEISTSDNDDDSDGFDDEDENEYDFEIQRKLMKLRKLFHRSTIQDVIKENPHKAVIVLIDNIDKNDSIIAIQLDEGFPEHLSGLWLKLVQCNREISNISIADSIAVVEAVLKSKNKSKH